MAKPKLVASTEIKIDKGVPCPSRRNRIWPFPEMEIGDSFFAPGKSGANLHVASRSAPSFKFTTRTVTENGVKGTRVWRVE